MQGDDYKYKWQTGSILHRYKQMKNLTFVGLSFALLIVLAFSSCNSEVAYSNQQSVSDEWKNTALIQFDFDHFDTISNYQFILSVRNNTDYEYQNIFFFVKLINPDGIISRDTVECQLADYRGKWLGAGFGKIKEVSTSFGSEFVLNRAGKYEIVIEHAMRTTNNEGLIGVEDVGIQIIKK